MSLENASETTALIAPVTSEENVTELPLAKRIWYVQLFMILLTFYACFMIGANVVTYDLIYTAVCAEYDIAADQCTASPVANTVVSNLLAVAALVTGIVSVFTLTVVSALSDRVGRKPALIWFMAFETLAIASYPFVAYAFPAHTSHWRLLVPYILTAIGGTPTLMSNLCVLYISDLLPEHQWRTHYLSMIIGASMLVHAVAPGIGGRIARAGVSPFEYLIGVCIGMAIGLFFYVVVAPESLTKKTRGGSRSPKDIVKLIAFKSCETAKDRRNARLLLLNFLLGNEFAIGFMDIVVLYAKWSFGWLAPRIGSNMFYMFSVRTFWYLWGFPVVYGQLTKRFSVHDRKLDRPDFIHMLASHVFTLLGYFGMGLARTSGQYTAGTILLANDAISGPVWINSLLKHISTDQKGEFMAALSLINKLVGALFPAVLMKIYTTTLETWPSLPFQLIGTITALLIGSLYLLKPERS